MKPDINMPLIYNVVYRPDLNGIEQVWRLAKQYYRTTVDNNKALNQEWDQRAVVESSIVRIHQDT